MTLDIPYDRAASLDDALRLLAAKGPVPTILAGGTDVMVWIESGAWTPQRIIDISPLRGELAQVEDEGDVVSLGPLLTHAQVATHPVIREKIPLLAAASGTLGAPPIRNRGTLGGNIGGSSPAGDILPVLLATDATIVLQSQSGQREVPYRQYCTGYRRTARRDDEIITRIRVPRLPAATVARWYKVGGRAAQACSKVCVAAMGKLGDDGRVDRVELAAGSCAATPIRLLNTAKATVGRLIDEDLLAAARAAAATDISPIDDQRSTAHYREHVVVNLIGRFFSELAGR